MKLIAEMIASALRTSWRVLVVIVFLLSLGFNVATAAVGLTYSVAASVVEAVTGRPQMGSVKSKDRTIGQLREELGSVRLKAAELEGKAAGLGWRVQKAESKVSELTHALKVPKKVVFEGVEVTVPEAVARVTNRVKGRTAKVASADMAATFGQSIPWIGIGVVVAATTYDLKTACDTMGDMHALEVAFNPEAANDPAVKEVCGLKVPSKEEIWEKVKASPGKAWDMAKAAMPDLPEMPSMPDIDWTFWD